MRPSARQPQDLRPIKFQTGVSRYAEGSCLINYGHTQVLCTASVEESVPSFMRNKGSGWVTAEYAMLPRATHTRSKRESASNKPSGRSQEIQRLIGRSLRAVVDLPLLGERSITIDCDVLQADGGTRTAAITGGYVALCHAVNYLLKEGKIYRNPIIEQVAAISCGIYKGQVVADLDYDEDSNAEADANFVMNGSGNIIEIQGTAEKISFTPVQFQELLGLAGTSIETIIQLQKQALPEWKQ
ncbi:MAG: ribonuclease PH [Alphaproteobacteria bacterium]|nr:ribonuclease PH [Alphaproteobacteria bacterium]